MNALLSTSINDPVPNNLVCIDTSTNRIGINTLDPSYGIHIIDSLGMKIEPPSSTSNIEIIFKNLPNSLNLSNLNIGQLYTDTSGFLKIKLQ